MGKKLIIPGADFSTNGIAIPMIIKIKAGQSVVIDGITYSGGTNGEAYELDTFPTTFHEESAVTYLEKVTVNSKDFVLDDGYFRYQNGLTIVSFLSNFASTNDLSSTFAYCGNLERIVGMENIDTAGCTDFSQMLRSCSKLYSVNLQSIDTSSATNISNMLAGCTALTSVNLSSFDTTTVTNMSRIFSGCDHLTEVILGPKWDMLRGANVEDMFYRNLVLASIIAPNCQSTEYGVAGTQLMALINAIQGSGFTATRNNTPLVITCGDNKTVTGTYVHGTGWSWVVQS